MRTLRDRIPVSRLGEADQTNQAGELTGGFDATAVGLLRVGQSLERHTDSFPRLYVPAEDRPVRLSAVVWAVRGIVPG